MIQKWHCGSATVPGRRLVLLSRQLLCCYNTPELKVGHYVTLHSTPAPGHASSLVTSWSGGEWRYTTSLSTLISKILRQLLWYIQQTKVCLLLSITGIWWRYRPDGDSLCCRPAPPPGWSSVSAPAWAASVTASPPPALPSTGRPLGRPRTTDQPPGPVRHVMTCWWPWQTLRVRLNSLVFLVKPIREHVSFI